MNRVDRTDQSTNTEVDKNELQKKQELIGYLSNNVGKSIFLTPALNNTIWELLKMRPQSRCDKMPLQPSVKFTQPDANQREIVLNRSKSRKKLIGCNSSEPKCDLSHSDKENYIDIRTIVPSKDFN